MDELKLKLEPLLQQFNQNDGIFWIPIRHHSTACTYYLNSLLEQYQPDMLLIEGPVDFDCQLASLTHSQTKPPIALYSEYLLYPFSETSPEWHAMRWASQHQKIIKFIDLPLQNKNWSMVSELLKNQKYLYESSFQYSNYIKKLTQKTGCRHSNELWERYFELQTFSDAKTFFQNVFEYCTASRLSQHEHADEKLNHCREQYMRQMIAKYIDKSKICFIITGGYHTVSLFNYAQEEALVIEEATNSTPTWLIRYSLDRLDANNGYHSGMPAPEFYQRLFHLRSEHQYSTALNHAFVLDNLNLLDEHDQFIVPINTAQKLIICEQTLNLAKLRGHIYPGLYDLQDALQSTLIKDQIRKSSPLLSTVYKVLAGNCLGKVDINQPPLPLVNELYQKLKKTRFKLESTNIVTTTFSPHKASDKMTTRLALLHQCEFLEIDFCSKISGPDWINGCDLQLQNETWEYAWTPWVEIKLANMSIEGINWQEILIKQIQTIQISLDENNLTEGQQFFIKLILMNCLDLAPNYCEAFREMVLRSSDIEQLENLLFCLLRLHENNILILNKYQSYFEKLMAETWSQLMFSLPLLNQQPLSNALATLTNIQELTREFQGYLPEQWQTAWLSQLKWLKEFGRLKTGLYYACRALIDDIDKSENQLYSDLYKLFQLDVKRGCEAFCSILKIVPHWIYKIEQHSMITLLNSILASWTNTQFLDALPELRMLFSHLSPKEIEGLSEQIASLNHWHESVATFTPHINEEDMLQAQRLYNDLLEYLETHGLSQWIIN